MEEMRLPSEGEVVGLQLGDFSQADGSLGKSPLIWKFNYGSIAGRANRHGLR